MTASGLVGNVPDSPDYRALFRLSTRCFAGSLQVVNHVEDSALQVVGQADSCVFSGSMAGGLAGALQGHSGLDISEGGGGAGRPLHARYTHKLLGKRLN